jgi:hypothetical protein
MPHSDTKKKPVRHDDRKPARKHAAKSESRYTVALIPSVASEVKRYAETIDTSVSRAISALVRLGLESQENRKREFFKRLKENLADDDPNQQDRLVDEFRTLILGR